MRNWPAVSLVVAPQYPKDVREWEGSMAGRSFAGDAHEELADVRKRAVVGAGVQTGPTLEYWKKHA